MNQYEDLQYKAALGFDPIDTYYLDRSSYLPPCHSFSSVLSSHNYPQENKSQYTSSVIFRRPISTPIEQPSRYTTTTSTSASAAHGYLYNQAGIENWLQGTTATNVEATMPGILPTISWLCSCSLCINSVQQFIAAVNNSNGVYAANISGSGPVYNELLATTGYQVAPPPIPKLNGGLVMSGNGLLANPVANTAFLTTVMYPSFGLKKEKIDLVGRSARIVNGFTIPTAPLYTMTTAQNGFAGQAMGMQFYNNSYGPTIMNGAETQYGNANGYFPAAAAGTYSGNSNESSNKRNVGVGTTESDEEEIDVVGE